MRGAGRERQYEGLVVVVLECRRGSELTSGGLSSSSLYLSFRLRKSEDPLAFLNSQHVSGLCCEVPGRWREDPSQWFMVIKVMGAVTRSVGVALVGE